MSDFGTLVSRIRTDLNRGTDFDGRIKQAIEAAIRFYRARRFGFNMKRATSSIAAGTEFMALPEDFLEVDTVRINDGDYNDLMTEVNFSTLDEISTNPDYRSEPYWYAIQNRELRLYPIPDGTYTLTMSFLYDLTDVSISASDGASNAWTTEAGELLKAHATADLLETYIGGPESASRAQLEKMRAAEIYAELKRRANREQSTGRIRPFS